MTILDQIFAAKYSEVETLLQKRPLADVRADALQTDPALDFIAALRYGSHESVPSLIAEVKLASPSLGMLAVDEDPLRLARQYMANGAVAISVLTDQRYFHGNLDYLVQIAALNPRLPTLRKDFIVDPYQIFEARAAGADAILLIVAGLALEQLCNLHRLALSLGMAALIEVHSLEELRVALNCGPRLIGINNRDLHTFQIDLNTTERLRTLVPAGICVVSESGIKTRQDVLRLARAGVDAILVGEALVTARDVGKKIRELIGEN